MIKVGTVSNEEQLTCDFQIIQSILNHKSPISDCHDFFGINGVLGAGSQPWTIHDYNFMNGQTQAQWRLRVFIFL